MTRTMMTATMRRTLGRKMRSPATRSFSTKNAVLTRTCLSDELL
ncbi:unnamed protein product [Nippostrongylus brasiliensis]|uniref:Uncharacterized protein n=1 Tax=Nippostrongylus brasiliensis TaxID=27835 RepID=A0A0N4XI67_NIPBR|nr:unnamed protein product [Nippostrongylus brasiliensis]